MAFSVTSLSKAYAGVPVLKDVDLSVEDGEIHALLGANGAGKSTLIKCISGAVQPDAGDIVVGGQHFHSLNPKEGRRAGVAVIYQELALAMTLNVTDNIFLGQELRVGPFVRRRAQRIEAVRWLHQLGVDLNPQADLAKVGSAEMQLVEIVKSLRTHPKVLILDEPTASLTELEAEQLRQHLLSLKQRNLPVLYVTHRLGEVFGLADRVTVLRGGAVVLTSAVRDVTREDLVEAIVGRQLGGGLSAAEDEKVEARKPLMSVSRLVASGIGPLDLELHPGEILGIFGLVGSGRTELLETLFGARRMHSGVIELAGRRLTLRDTADAVAAGIALVPSDRLRTSIFGSMSSLDNMLLPSFVRLGRLGFRRRGHERRAFSQVAETMNLQPRLNDLEARRFSGGNQQKLVLGRWLQQGQPCTVLLMDEPTQGVDVGGRRDLYDALRDFTGVGERCVVFTSSEPEELLQLTRRVAVLSAGAIVGVLRGEEITERALLELAHTQEHLEEA